MPTKPDVFEPELAGHSRAATVVVADAGAPEPREPDQVLTYDEAADFMKISRRTLERLVRVGKLRPARMHVSASGRPIARFLRTDLLKFLKSMR